MSKATPHRVVTRTLLRALCFVGAFLYATVWAADVEMSSFDIPAGNAESTLKVFSEQSGHGLIASSELLTGARTRAIRGKMEPNAALIRMLEGSGLVAVADAESGAYTVRRLSAPNARDAAQPKQSDRQREETENLIPEEAPEAADGAPSAMQAAPSHEEQRSDEVITLSPFTVVGSEERGYRATNTLAGTRLNTKLRDVGSSLSVMTSEFMSDVNGNNAETLLAYGLNTEVAAGEHATYSNSSLNALDARGGMLTQVSSRTNPSAAQRVRGLAEATVTRDFFLTSIAFDTYNTSEVTINRGPNSLLFGVGSPGGIINNGLKQAVLYKDIGEVSTMLGERGSYRATVDFNKVIVKDRLAVRVAGLKSDTEYRQRPAFKKDERYYGAINATLFENKDVEWLGRTGIKLTYENGKMRSVPVNNIPFYDFASSWFALPDNVDEILSISQSEVPRYIVNGTYRPKWTVNNVNGGIDLLGLPGPNESFVWDHYPVVTPSLTATQASVGLPDASIDAVQGRVNWARSENAPAYTRNLVDQTFTLPFYMDKINGFRVGNIADPTVYDNRKILLTGRNQFLNQDFDVFNARLEQLFLQGDAGLELAYNSETFDQEDYFPFEESGYPAIYIDVNEKLSNGMDNPNLGRPLIMDRGRSTRDESTWDRESYQATGFVRFDFSDSSGVLGAVLGKHVLTGFVGRQRVDFATVGHQNSYVDLNDSTDVSSYTGGRKINDWRRNVYNIVYIGPSMLGDGYDSLSGLRITDYYRSLRPQDGDSYTVQYQPDNPVWRGDDTDRFFQADLGVQEFPRLGDRSRREIDSRVFSVQSYFFDDHVVGLVGWRSDELTSTSRINANDYRQIAPETLDYRFADGVFDTRSVILGEGANYEKVQKGNTFSWSIVTHKPKKWLPLPGDLQISLHYNRSENFDASGVRRDLLGRVIPSPTGTTTDYGFSLNTPDDRFTVRVNWFKSGSKYATAEPVASGLNFSPRRILDSYRQYELAGHSFADLLAFDYVNNGGIDHSGDFSSFQEVYDTILGTLPDEIRARFQGFDPVGFSIWEPNPGESTTRDFISRGLEVELVTQVTDNWTLAANIGKQETITSNSWVAAREVISGIVSQTRESPLGTMVESPHTGQNSIINEEYRRVLVTPMVGAIAKDDQVSQEQRKWRANLISKYAISRGALKGLEIGLALRYQGKVATGYEITVEDGVSTPVIDSPFWGPDSLDGDVWVKYGRAINDRIDWSAQLNVRNAYRSNGGEFIPIFTNPDGRDVVFRNPNPTTIELTNTFRF